MLPPRLAAVSSRRCLTEVGLSHRRTLVHIVLGRMPSRCADKSKELALGPFTLNRKRKPVLCAEHHETSGDRRQSASKRRFLEVQFTIVLGAVVGIIPRKTLCGGVFRPADKRRDRFEPRIVV